MHAVLFPVVCILTNLAGHEIIMQCESDPGAQQVLCQQFPGTLLMPDVRAIQRLPEGCEILAAGIPCIDVSCAGQRKGMLGSRTSLATHVFRLLRQAAADRRPVPWLLIENVEAILNRHDSLPGDNGEPVISYIAQQVEALGYQSWAYRVVNTAAFGIPHNRRRVIFLASMFGDARDLLLSSGVLPCTGSCEDAFSGRLCFRCTISEETDTFDTNYAIDMSNGRNAGVAELLPTMTTTNLRTLLLLSDSRAGMLRLSDAERMQGFEPGWTEACYPIQGSAIEANRRHTASRDVDDGVCKRARYGLIGNAVSVPVAKWIGDRLFAPCTNKYWRSIGVDKAMGMSAKAATSALPVERCNHSGVPVRRNERIKKKMAEDAAKSAKAAVAAKAAASEVMTWPRCAWFVAGIGRHSTQVSDSPVYAPLTKLTEFVESLGASPGEEALRTYLHRLRETGFSAANLLSKFHQCGIGASLVPAKVIIGHRSGTAAANSAAEAKRKAVREAERDGAARALAIGLQKRCGECENCNKCQGGTSRRCLKLRAAAAAAQGHVGAQLTVLGADAVGTLISVWWSGNEQYYDGKVGAWDSYRYCHSIEYDDGEFMPVSLWEPHEQIQVRQLPMAGFPRKRQRITKSKSSAGKPTGKKLEEVCKAGPATPQSKEHKTVSVAVPSAKELVSAVKGRRSSRTRLSSVAATAAMASVASCADHVTAAAVATMAATRVAALVAAADTMTTNSISGADIASGNGSATELPPPAVADELQLLPYTVNAADVGGSSSAKSDKSTEALATTIIL